MSLLHPSRLLSRSMMAQPLHAMACVSSVRPYNSRSTNDEKASVQFQPVYVNHLSKLVLEHLQNFKQEWLIRRGLDRGLRINDDGTFVLRFPLNEYGREAGRIWTSIDPSNKQHHLSVFRGSLVARYGLKDPETLMSKEKVKAEDAKARVRSIVDEMVKTLDDIDRQLHTIP